MADGRLSKTLDMIGAAAFNEAQEKMVLNELRTLNRLTLGMSSPALCSVSISAWKLSAEVNRVIVVSLRQSRQQLNLRIK
jgi:hypothetical protein